MHKKKRSAKQLANDRRLGRMAKKRGKKKVTRKKATRRKNPSRYGSRLFVIFKVTRDGAINFYNGGWPISGVWGSKGQAALYKTKIGATDVANALANKVARGSQLGVTHESTTVAEIKKRCGGKV